MNIGIIGIGYWGPNLVRNFAGLNSVDNIIVCDRKQDRLQMIKQRFPFVETVLEYNELLRPSIDAIVIATPVDTHYQFAKTALESGKHIWVEKPFTSSSPQAIELLELAERKKLNIFVDHTFIYTGAVQKMKEIVTSGELGELIYFDSVRVNLGLFQHDVNVMWDLAPHDLSIMNYLIPENKVLGVSATGIANFSDQENIAHLSVQFENNCFAHFHVNWTSPVKIRQILVGGKKKMLSFDDMQTSEKIKVYDSRVDFSTKETIYEALVQYRTGDMHSPKVSQVEALSAAAEEFISSITEQRLPLTNGYDGLKVVRVLEASNESIKKGGLFIPLSD